MSLRRLAGRTRSPRSRAERIEVLTLIIAVEIYAVLWSLCR